MDYIYLFIYLLFLDVHIINTVAVTMYVAPGRDQHHTVFGLFGTFG